MVEELLAIESLGGSCRCGKCPPGGKEYTLKEERELALIEIGLSHEGKTFTAVYPWIIDPSLLPDNKLQAVAVLHSLEEVNEKYGTGRNVY